MAGGNMAVDGDRVFLGVESRVEAGALNPGLVAMARNTRMRSGKLETRRGIVKMNWAGRRGASFPLVFAIDFTEAQPFARIYGAGRFDDPNGLEWMVIAASVLESEGARVWAGRPDSGLMEVPLGHKTSGPRALLEIDGEVEFCQAFNNLLMFRSDCSEGNRETLELTDLLEGFHVPAQTAAATPGNGDGTEEIPESESGLFLQNRMFIPYGRDLVAVSDALDYTRYAPPTATFRINQGSSDRLVGLFAFNDSTIVASKGSSVNVVSNLVADAAGNFTGAVNDVVTTSWGFIARKSVVQAGADLIGLSQMGVMSIRQTEQNKLQGVDVALSAPMEAVMRRINWQFADGAAGAYWDSRYYLAVPLDDGEALGGEVIWEGAAYKAGVLRVYGLEPGRRYRFVFGTWDGGLNVSALEFYSRENQSEVDFTAAREYVILSRWFASADDSLVLGSLRPLFSGTNNAVLVYDFVRQQWDGYDDGRACVVKAFVKLDYQGKERLFFVGADGFVCMYEEGFEDEVFEAGGWAIRTGATFPLEFPINFTEEPPVTRVRRVEPRAVETEWTLRGYGLRALTDKGYQKADIGESRLRGLELAVRTWNPSFSIYVRPEGVGEEYLGLGPVTRSRSRYTTPWNAPDWNATNALDDHGRPWREDYSVALEDGTVDFPLVFPLSFQETQFYLGSGVNFEAHQDSLERVRIHGRAQAAQVRVLNTSGRIELLRCQVDTAGGRQRFGGLT